MDIPELKVYRDEIEENLNRHLPPEHLTPGSIHQSMRYSTCGGGKRIRGTLCLLSCEAVGGKREQAMTAACALEMVHSYSLIHDDLPCMDDDDLRRGKPTNHRVFGEAIALLAGDALLTQAVEVMVKDAPQGMEKPYWNALRELITAIDTRGMIGGQVMDLEAENRMVTLEELQEIHKRKTGALIRASLRMGAIIGEGTESELDALTEYGEAVGLAFQIVDDLLDLVADPVVLGKAVGSDLKNQKATYGTIMGIEQARHLAGLEISKAKAALEPLGAKAQLLMKLADYFLERDH